MASRFSLAPRARATAEYVGNEREPVLRVDTMIANPEALVELAAGSQFAPAYGPGGGYPGLRARAPRDYVETILRNLGGPIIEAFSLGAVTLARVDSAFSIATLPPERLVPPQRAPHVDTTNAWQFAILHYLCPADQGGTAFYRHRATGFETLTEERLAAYKRARMEESVGDGYIDDGDLWFERIGEVPASFNRLVVYRSHLFHSGQIPAPDRLSPDPRRGRLTLNLFVTFAPVEAVSGSASSADVR
ncbi:DUF6445 family protein [Sphingomonas sp. ASY06-1R]|jgi:hypothetical protein|uniref:DUF6445 family protein n=1 Tax=Sphingomonas sp. ASY06-1R TaxID=3445771 RepID=UPI003FA24E52